MDHCTRLTMWEHPLEAAKKAEERDKLGPMPVSHEPGGANGWMIVQFFSLSL